MPFSTPLNTKPINIKRKIVAAKARHAITVLPFLLNKNRRDNKSIYPNMLVLLVDSL